MLRLQLDLGILSVVFRWHFGSLCLVSLYVRHDTFFFFFLNNPAPPNISPLPHPAPLPIKKSRNRNASFQPLADHPTDPYRRVTMSHPSDPRTPGSPGTEMGRRRVLQALGAASVAGLPAWSFAQPTAQVNTTKLAVTDTEVVVGQLHSATGDRKST